MANSEYQAYTLHYKNLRLYEDDCYEAFFYIFYLY